MNNSKKKIRFTVLLIVGFFITCFIFAIFRVEAFEDSSELDLLLYENADMQKVVDEIKSVDADIQISEYPEVSLLHIELPDSVSVEEILCNNRIQTKIESEGNIPQIELDRIDLGASYSGESVQGGIDAEAALPMSDEMIFNLMGWHVDEVTEQKLSLEISTGAGIKIALIDSGVDYNHPVLAGNIDMANGKSYVSNEDNVMDTNGHGTMIAGIIKQIAPNAIITPYRVIGDSSGESLWTIRAILDAVNDGNDIINASIGTYKCKDVKSEKMMIKTFERAMKYAEKNDVMVVASSGNLGLDLDQYYKVEHIQHLPGSIKEVNAVSAVSGKQITSYSNYGSEIQYCAPGGDVVIVDGYLDLSYWIYCLYPTYMDNGISTLGIPQGYTFSYGTSLSAPMVSSAAADVLSQYKLSSKKYKVKDIQKILSKGAIDLGTKGKDPYYGDGQINIYNSLMDMTGK